MPCVALRIYRRKKPAYWWSLNERNFARHCKTKRVDLRVVENQMIGMRAQQSTKTLVIGHVDRRQRIAKLRSRRLFHNASQVITCHASHKCWCQTRQRRLDDHTTRPSDDWRRSIKLRYNALEKRQTRNVLSLQCAQYWFVASVEMSSYLMEGVK